jgi:phenylacetate-coenzyme A ligase PaaK-like adenylate-forming protein
MGFGSVISRLARAQLAGQLDLGPEVVVSIGEPLPPEDDAVIGQAWGCPVHEGYGCSELGWLAMSTGTGGSMVHFDDQFVLEPLGADGSVLALGSDSTTVCVTTLARTGYPLIRYQLADRVRTLPPDPASGCGFTRIQSVLGRDDDWFRYGGIEIHPSTFRSALLTFPGIDEYQVVQTIDGAVVRAVASRTSLDTSVVAAAVAQALQRVGLQEPRVRVEYVTEIDRPAGQKLQRFVPLV